MKARIPGAQNQGNMMKKIQQMQEDMTRIQEEIEATEYTSSVGGGAVEVTVNGSHEVLSIKMQPDVVDPEDIEMLEDLLISALNESIKKAKISFLVQDKMQKEFYFFLLKGRMK